MVGPAAAPGTVLPENMDVVLEKAIVVLVRAVTQFLVAVPYWASSQSNCLLLLLDLLLF